MPLEHDPPFVGTPIGYKHVISRRELSNGEVIHEQLKVVILRDQNGVIHNYQLLQSCPTTEDGLVASGIDDVLLCQVCERKVTRHSVPAACQNCGRWGCVRCLDSAVLEDRFLVLLCRPCKEAEFAPRPWKTRIWRWFRDQFYR